MFDLWIELEIEECGNANRSWSAIRGNVMISKRKKSGIGG
jgi:hypothetical protein